MASRTIYYTNEKQSPHSKLLEARIRESADGVIIGFPHLLRLTEKTVPLVYRSLMAVLPHSGTLIFDLSNVESIDSRGLAFIITLHDRLDSENRPFYLLGLKPSLLRIFRITQIDELIPIYSLDSSLENEFHSAEELNNPDDANQSFSDLDFIQRIETQF
ncbi:MAG: STAS domain-containing protein [Calditrichaeota bacterium]|nr:STAS domain-containing protein [Calditrichota bacterium]